MSFVQHQFQLLFINYPKPTNFSLNTNLTFDWFSVAVPTTIYYHSFRFIEISPLNRLKSK